jgi:hypothetical protein
MPPVTEELEIEELQIIPRKEYINFKDQNPLLIKMPFEMRKDLPLLKEEIK